jgi:hypothetical protein
VGAVEPQRGCDGITAQYLPDRSACIAASLKLDSSYRESSAALQATGVDKDQTGAGGKSPGFNLLLQRQ